MTIPYGLPFVATGGEPGGEPDMPDMQFDDLDMQAHPEALDGLLGLQAPEDMVLDGGQMGPPLSELSEDPVELSATNTLPNLSDADVAALVEHELLELLEAEERRALQVVCGERPDLAGDGMEAVSSEFQGRYARAVLVNPAIRWYAKFANLLPASKFGVRNGSLAITMTPGMFAKVVAPFVHEFRGEWAVSSPLTAAVQTLARTYRRTVSKSKWAEIAAHQVRKHGAIDDDFDPALVDFTDLQINDRVTKGDVTKGGVTKGDLTIQGDGLSEDDQVKPVPDVTTAMAKLQLRLTDLSHAAVANYVASCQLTDDLAEAHLLDEGFTKAAAQEVMGLVRYQRRLARRRQGLPEGNRGAGDINFVYE